MKWAALLLILIAGGAEAKPRLAAVHSQNGVRAFVNADHSSRFQCLINNLDGAAYRIRFMGGYNYRTIAGTNRLSKHALGNALDINQTSRNRVTAKFPAGINRMATGCMLTHGAVWRHPDTGHFEVPGAGPRRGRSRTGRRHR